MQSDTQESGKAADRRGKSPLTKILPTDRISFEKQASLIRGFAAIYESNSGKAVSNEKAGEVLTPVIAAGTVIQVNAFFVDTGILTKSPDGTGFIPSPECLAYHKACQWGADKAGIKLRTLFEKTWFSKALVPRLQLGPKPTDDCIAILAEESEATKEHEDRLSKCLDFLKLATIIKVDGTSVSLQWPDRYSGEQNPAVPKGEESAVPISFNLQKNNFGQQNDSEQHTLYLSSDKKRMVTVFAPLTISEAEYKRICDWIKVALIVGVDEQK